MSDAPAPPDLRQRRLGLLNRLIDVAYGTMMLVGRRFGELNSGEPQPSRFRPQPGDREIMTLIVKRITASIHRLCDVVERIADGRPPPTPNPRRPPDPGLPVVTRLFRMRTPPLPCLPRIRVPGGQDLRDRLIRLLRTPGMAELMQAEPAIRRAAGPPPGRWACAACSAAHGSPAPPNPASPPRDRRRSPRTGCRS